MVSVLSRREIKAKTWIAFYSHLLAQTHTLLNIHIFAGQTTFSSLCFTSFDSFIWTSTLVVPVSPVSGLSLVLIILFQVWKLLLFSVNCNHIYFSRELKKEEESGVSLTSWWFQLTHTWSGWWTIVKARFWQKLRACQISSAAPESFLELAVNVRRSSLEGELKTGEGFMKREVSLCLAISISHFSSLAGVELPA